MQFTKAIRAIYFSAGGKLLDIYIAIVEPFPLIYRSACWLASTTVREQFQLLTDR